MHNLKLYGPDFSYFVRVCRLMCQYKNLNYELSMSPKGEFIQPFSAEHERIHPFRKIPTLFDDKYEITESLAIASYLEDIAKPSLLANKAVAKAQDLALANMIQSYIHSSVMRNIVLEIAFPKGDNNEIRWSLIEDNKAQALKDLAWLNERLGPNKHLFGNKLSLSDCYLIPMLDYFTYLPSQINLIKDLENLQHYLTFHKEQSYSKGVLEKPQINR
ncbi:glutathione S-transferase family protein [Agaribacterium sp. ZY112]|uniref:glutathione S-transferase family protein n=1 Tax=Agaribacterium sp. ZY112 TaxID=3233574 RepID=UPI00352405EC